MTIARTSCPVLLVLTIAALALGGCGKSDEEQIRSVASEFDHAVDRKDPGRACELLGPNAEAQLVAMASGFSRARGCAEFFKRSEPDDEGPSLTSPDDAKVRVRGDLATLTGRRDDEAIGLRKIDGDWRIDDLFLPSLQQPRADARLTRGTDEQQIRATATAANEALARNDYKRLCTLISPGAEAQFVMGAAFATLFSGAKPPANVSCATILRDLAKLAKDDGDGGLVAVFPSRDDCGGRTSRSTTHGRRSRFPASPRR